MSGGGRLGLVSRVQACAWGAGVWTGGGARVGERVRGLCRGRGRVIVGRMPTLVLSPRHSDDSNALWRAAIAAGWRTRRLQRIGEAAELPAELAGAEVALYGETMMADAVAGALGLGLVEPPHDWLPRLPPAYRLREVSLTTLGAARRLTGPVFVKPADEKWFPARVYADTVDVDPLIDDALPVLVSEPVRFGLEVRAFVQGRAVATLSAYVRDGQLAKMSDGTWPMSQIEEAAARELLAWLLADPEVEAPAPMVIDVGHIAGRGWAVVEANPAWASGLCGGDPAAVLPVLRACVVDGARGQEIDPRWLRPRGG